MIFVQIAFTYISYLILIQRAKNHINEVSAIKIVILFCNVIRVFFLISGHRKLNNNF